MIQEEYRTAYCPHCKEEHPAQVIDIPSHLRVKGVDVLFDEQRLLCDRVYEDFLTATEITRNLHRAANAFQLRGRAIEVVRAFDNFKLVEVKETGKDATFFVEEAVWRHQEHPLQETVTA